MCSTQSYTLNKRSKLAISIAAALGMAAGFGDAALAQDDADLDVLEEVYVTGSRIVRRDFNSNSPIRTIDAAQFEQQSGLNIESYLNQLPDYSPANSPVTTQAEINATPVNTLGIASVSLRGFGPNRSLVLVDGKRPVPTNALMVTDINSIPSALIQRVETITGGASSVYGADAVAGVTNFILRKDFEGLEIDTQYGVSEAGDGEEFRISGLMGTDVLDGRGNITVGFEYYDRKEALEIERSFYTDSWNDPNTPGELFFQGFNGFTDFFNNANYDTMAVIFADMDADTDFRNVGSFSRYRFNPDGTLFPIVGDNLNLTNGIIDGKQWAAQNVLDSTTPIPDDVAQVVKWNSQDALASAPQDRYSFFTGGTFDITDDISLFARGTFARSNSKTRLNYGSTASYGWEGTVPFDPATDSPVNPLLDYTDPAVVAAVLADPAAFANTGFIPTNTAGAQHPVTHELAIALLSRGDPTANWIVETFPSNSLGVRKSDNTNIVWQIETGINMNLPFRDWTGEFYYSHGEVNNNNVSTGFQSLQRWRTMMTLPDYGRNATIMGNQNGLSRGFGTVPVECTSGFYETIFFSDTPPSEDCSRAVDATLSNRLTSTQDIVEINFQGGLVDLPAGELRAAGGFQMRKNHITYTPDLLQSSVSFEDQVIGVYPVGEMDAGTEVKDYYLEALVPVVGDVGFVQGVELELGYRYSDYDTSDSASTYKALANIEVNDWLRLRGGYNRATRAPNVGEKFLGLQEVFLRGVTTNFGDACGLRSNAPFGAGGAASDPVLDIGEPDTQLASGQTAAGANSTYLICQAQMGAAGAADFYDNNAGGASGGNANWVYQEGNPDVEAEIADTYTAGFVASSPWQDNPWLADMTLSFDYWQVDIEDAIQQYSVDYARYLCYGVTTVTTAAEAAAQAATTDCQNVGRNQSTGGSTTALLRYGNLATINTKGIDIAVSWNAQLEDLGFNIPGGLALNVQSTFIDSYKTKESQEDFDVEVEWAGSLGPTLTGTNPGAYDYRIFTSLMYMQDNWNVGLRWRHLPSVITAAEASQNAVIANNASASNGGAGVPLSYTPLTNTDIGSYNIFDMSFNWTISESLSLRSGITNLFDTSPEITGRTTGYGPGTDLTAVCGGAPGCVNPTSYQLANSGAGITSPGYYDTLGRRFFIGMKAHF